MKNLFMIAAAAALLFTACAKDEQVAPETKIAELGFASITAEAMTRATTPLDAGFKFNLTGSATDYPDVVEAREVTYADSKYTITGDAIFVSSARILTAWAPSGVNQTTTNQFLLTPGTAAVDFLYQPSKELTATNCTAVQIAMKHAMAKITFKFTFPVGYIPNPTATSLILKGTPGASTFNITNGAWGTPGTAADLTIVDASTPISIPADGFSTLVVPMASVDDDTLSIACQVNAMPDASTVNIKGLKIIDAGKNYVVTIKVTDKTLTIGSVTQEDWEDGGAGDAELI